ncbi:MAG: nitrous oxide-stimulated promoter family protein [Anaerolineae bacterium]|nr:nitrous oxide-stimulated promoter family protein [Anaerolineae bacterium]
MMQIPRDRLKRERYTIQVMIRLYCRQHHHSPDTLCPECQELLAYAEQRLERCPFQANKPTCARCPIHCYKADKREQVRRVMRYAGPRMMLYHPILALWHLFDEIILPRLVSEKS